MIDDKLKLNARESKYKPKSKKVKILLIGQAPPIQKQDIPYDTTMLYEWLDEIGVSKKEAQRLFDFEAMTDKMPGVNAKGGHIPPKKIEMSDYVNRVLYRKIALAKVVILMGNSSKKYFGYDQFFIEDNMQNTIIFTMIHPSKRNIKLYRDNKETILGIFKRAIEFNNKNN